ncbi:LuxR family transcriptional regulator [soil metagenome]
MLIGRDAEQSAVAQLIAGARIGRSGVLVLSGEAGIGKTSLLEDAAARADDMQALWAAGSAAERNVSFGALLQLLRPVVHLLDKIPQPQAQALGVALAMREGKTNDRFAVGAATLSLLSRCAEERPLLLLVDDAHALDRPSADAVVFVGRRLVADRVAMLVATRDEPGAAVFDADLPQVRLGGLGLAPASELLRGHAKQRVTEDLITRLHAETAGNPLAIVELAGEIDSLASASPHIPIPVPERVARSFTRRIETLSLPAQAALLLAAITGGDLAVVAAAAEDLDTGAAHLAEAEAAGLLTIAADRVVFRHPLVRSGVYAAAPHALRRRAHRAVADALPPRDHERRAWHLAESVIGFDKEAAAALDRVGEGAMDRSAYDVAATANERAALLSEDHTQRARRFFAAGESAWLAGQVERAGPLLRHSARLTSDVVMLADIDAVRGNMALRAGSLEDARAIFSDAASRIAPTDPDRAVSLLGDLVLVHFYLAAAAGAVAVAATLDGLLPRLTSDLTRSRGDLMVGVAHVLAGDHGIDRIRSAVLRIAASDHRTDDPRQRTWEVLGTLFLRESDTGRDLIARTLEDLRQRGALGTLSTVLFYAARDDATTERWQDAVAKYQEAIALSRETGSTTDLVVCLAGLSWLQGRMGLAEECVANAEEAMRLGDRHRVHLGRIWAMYARGDLALAVGDAAVAVERFTELSAELESIGVGDVDLWPGPELAEALLRVGRTEEARDAATAYAEKARAKDQPWPLARAERALALTSHGDDAERHFERALAHHEFALDAYEDARTRLAHGAVLRRRRRRVAARPYLRSAVEIFDRLGAEPWARAAAGELAATGETPHRRGASAAEMLTSQELQITRMLGAGKTTREAAAALFLSPKTVEYHLRHVYTKLGIHTRAELALVIADSRSARR